MRARLRQELLLEQIDELAYDIELLVDALRERAVVALHRGECGETRHCTACGSEWFADEHPDHGNDCPLARDNAPRIYHSLIDRIRR
jgi:hypothetical protein